MTNKMEWVDEMTKQQDASSLFFSMQEGDNRIQLLTHAARLAQVWDGAKYRPAKEGDENISIKGVCWVLQDGKIKEAKLPYTVVKQIRALMEDPDWAFDEFPMPRMINIKVKNAKTKEADYSVVPSPKESEVPAEILEELKSKKTPEEVVEFIKSKQEQSVSSTGSVPYPDDGRDDPDQVPW